MTADDTAKPADSPWYTTTQAAQYLGMHRDTVLEAAIAGALQSARRGKRGWRRYRRDWLDAWLESLSERPAS